MGLLACEIPAEARERARRGIPARTLEDERAEERAIVKVHIRSRRSCDRFAMQDTLQIHSIIDSDSLSTSCIIKLH